MHGSQDAADREVPGRPELDEFDPLSVPLFLARNARALATATFLGGCLGVALALWLPNVYTAEARVVLPMSTGGALHLSGLSARAAEFGLDLGSPGSTDRRLFEQLAKSRSVADAVIARFELAKLQPGSGPDDVRSSFGRRLAAEARDGVIRIAYSDKDAARAAAICNAVVELLRSRFLGLQTSKAHTKRVFLEERLAKVHAELYQAEEAQKRLKLDRNAFEPKEQARASLTVISSLLEQLYRETVTARVLELSVGESTAPLLESHRKIAELKEQLRALEHDSAPVSGVRTASLPTGALIPLRALPQAEVDLTRGVRRVTILEQLSLLLTRECETARIEEINEVNSLIVLDEASVPSRKSAPSRRLIVLTFAAAAFVLGALRRWQREWVQRLRTAEPERAAMLQQQLGVWSRLL